MKKKERIKSRDEGERENQMDRWRRKRESNVVINNEIVINKIEREKDLKNERDKER